MTTALLISLLILVPTGDLKTRERHPLAPSLPKLTEAEEAKIEKVIERFILHDTGKLDGAAGLKALKDFNDLGPESIFNLIEGFNHAANIQASCPVVIIGKKIASILNASDDVELLTFAKETIGNGVTVARHMGTVKDLQLGVMLRRTAVQRRAASGDVARKAPTSMSLAELTSGMTKAKGPQLRALLTEAEKRQSAQVVGLLAAATTDSDSDVAKLGTSLLRKHVERQPADKVKALLKHERPEVRAAAARAAGSKYLRLGVELIALLEDADADAQQAAHQALVQLSGGMDHGPSSDASVSERAEARRRWREWWSSKSQASPKSP